ncbi:pre-peptidase C-terminal domain-containing protein [Tumebacillus permanentifrigoris]|uniref:Pre-peptidase n=1 Tax=Tumebacillus permanentifrigoris TaxID=378543 RepID=A0A316DG75_9BACL|nr:pre-peptidase C-terminal domain-containing protein [Tumebacillus permanentifrigoris]PWK16239.1 pre-peptidase [Tumebacillus permanentifrigoris]
MKKTTNRWLAGALIMLALAATVIQPAQAESTQQQQVQTQDLTKPDVTMPRVSVGGSPTVTNTVEKPNTLIPIPPMIPPTSITEPNNDLAHASSILAATLYQTSLELAADLDVFKITATKTARYHLSVKTPALNTFTVKVLNSTGAVVATGQSKQGIQQEIEFNAQASSVYYFQVSDVNGATTQQDYSLEFTESSGVYVYNSQNRILNYTVHRGLNNYRMDYTYDGNGVLLKKIKVAL